MRTFRKFALVGLLSSALSLPVFAAPGPVMGANVASMSGFHAQVVVGARGPVVGWYGGRYWDGHRYWDHDGWYAAHPGWRGGWGPGWNYRPEVVAPGLAIGWYGGRYWDGVRYWDRDGWYAAHPGWRGGWGPGWHYHP